MKSFLRPFYRQLPNLALLCLLAASLMACSQGPDEDTLEQRLATTIDLGWGWLKAENVILQQTETTDRGIMGTFSYTLVIQKDAHLLPQDAVTTFRKHIPQCKSVPIQKGKRCTLEETLLFVESATYGWVPDIIAQERPELLEYIHDASME